MAMAGAVGGMLLRVVLVIVAMLGFAPGPVRAQTQCALYTNEDACTTAIQKCNNPNPMVACVCCSCVPTQQKDM